MDSVACVLLDGNDNTLDEGQSTLFRLTAALSQVGFNGPPVQCYDFYGVAHTYNVSMNAIAIGHLMSSRVAGRAAVATRPVALVER